MVTLGQGKADIGLPFLPPFLGIVSPFLKRGLTWSFQTQCRRTAPLGFGEPGREYGHALRTK